MTTETMHACQNCDWIGVDGDLEEIQHYSQRVEPGEAEPSGECPECGALCHEIKTRFSVTVARETTESAEIEVFARNQGEAEERALELARSDYGSSVTWTADENSGMQSEPYSTGNTEQLEEA